MWCYVLGICVYFVRSSKVKISYSSLMFGGVEFVVWFSTLGSHQFVRAPCSLESKCKKKVDSVLLLVLVISSEHTCIAFHFDLVDYIWNCQQGHTIYRRGQIRTSTYQWKQICAFLSSTSTNHSVVWLLKLSQRMLAILRFPSLYIFFLHLTRRRIPYWAWKIMGWV